MGLSVAPSHVSETHRHIHYATLQRRQAGCGFPCLLTQDLIPIRGKSRSRWVYDLLRMRRSQIIGKRRMLLCMPGFLICVTLELATLLAAQLWIFSLAFIETLISRSALPAYSDVAREKRLAYVRYRKGRTIGLTQWESDVTDQSLTQQLHDEIIMNTAALLTGK